MMTIAEDLLRDDYLEITKIIGSLRSIATHMIMEQMRPIALGRDHFLTGEEDEFHSPENPVSLILENLDQELGNVLAVAQVKIRQDRDRALEVLKHKS